MKKEQENLNEHIYNRFGLKIDMDKARKGFLSFVKNSILDILNPIVNPSFYEDKNELFLIQKKIISEFSRETFRDSTLFYREFDPDKKQFIRLIGDLFSNSNWETVITELQILLNLIFKYYKWNERDKFLKELEKYLDDFPIINLKIKKYKTKAPQFFPARNTIIDKKLLSLFGELETKEYKDSLRYFEIGFNNFIKAKTKPDLKKVVDDMHSAVDEFIKVFTGEKNKSFRSIFKSSDYLKYGIKNKKQREVFKNLKELMDEIKHGSNKDYDKADVEFILNETINLLSFLLSREFKK